MPLWEFGGQSSTFQSNEFAQAAEVTSILREEYASSETPVYVLHDIVIGAAQIDMLLIKSSTFVVVELKYYQGSIMGTENGEWTAVQKDGAEVEVKQEQNPFIQVRNQRRLLYNQLGSLLPRITPRAKSLGPRELGALVSCVLYFRPKSDFDKVLLSEKTKPWFIIANQGIFLERFRNLSSPDIYLTESDIRALLAKMGFAEKFDGSELVAERDLVFSETGGSIRQRTLPHGIDYIIRKNSRRDIIVSVPTTEHGLVEICEFNVATGNPWLHRSVRIPPTVWEEMMIDFLDVERTQEPFRQKDYVVSGGRKVSIYPLRSHGRDGISLAELRRDGKTHSPPRRVWFNQDSIRLLQELISELFLAGTSDGNK